MFVHVRSFVSLKTGEKSDEFTDDGRLSCRRWINRILRRGLISKHLVHLVHEMIKFGLNVRWKLLCLERLKIVLVQTLKGAGLSLLFAQFVQYRFKSLIEVVTVGHNDPLSSRERVGNRSPGTSIRR